MADTMVRPEEPDNIGYVSILSSKKTSFAVPHSPCRWNQFAWTAPGAPFRSRGRFILLQLPNHFPTGTVPGPSKPQYEVTLLAPRNLLTCVWDRSSIELKDNTVIVVLGASGDLAKKKTVCLMPYLEPLRT